MKVAPSISEALSCVSLKLKIIKIWMYCKVHIVNETVLLAKTVIINYHHIIYSNYQN